MRRLLGISGCVALTGLLLALAAPAAAEESGQWHAKGVLVILEQHTVKVEDRANHTVTLVDWDGAVFNSDGKPFLDKARYQGVGVTDMGVSSGGYKTFTDADGSKVFATYRRTVAIPPELRGTFEFIGGTGKYAGITGSGTYYLVFISDKAAWDELSGEYRIPTRP